MLLSDTQSPSAALRTCHSKYGIPLGSLTAKLASKSFWSQDMLQQSMEEIAQCAAKEVSCRVVCLCSYPVPAGSCPLSLFQSISPCCFLVVLCPCSPRMLENDKLDPSMAAVYVSFDLWPRTRQKSSHPTKILIIPCECICRVMSFIIRGTVSCCKPCGHSLCVSV